MSGEWKMSKTISRPKLAEMISLINEEGKLPDKLLHAALHETELNETLDELEIKVLSKVVRDPVHDGKAACAEVWTNYLNQVYKARIESRFGKNRCKDVGRGRPLHSHEGGAGF
jgi:hypothetical protein